MRTRMTIAHHTASQDMSEKVWTKGDKVSIPVSFGIFVKGDSRRYTTGFVEATFLEYTPEGLANIRLGTDIFTVSKAQLI